MHPRIPLSRPAVAAAVLSAGLSVGCSNDPRTDAERLARGREIIDRMSTKLASHPAISVTTREIRDRVKSSGQPEQVTISRVTTIRRPDRLYFKVSGENDNEGWYDGVGLTLAMHKEKVFGQARMPETLDKTFDAFHERYGVSTPLADFLYTSPAKALLTDSTTGGWVGRETINGEVTDHLHFKDTGVDWEIWIAGSGDPLPRRGVANFLNDKRLRRVETIFENWNFSPQISDDLFKPKVPADYEGIAIVQRASVLKNVPADDAAPTAGTVKK
jgi:hypothetical protein